MLTFYEGYLLDEPYDSYASGSIIDGAFYGTIKSKKLGKFFIEPSRRYNSTLDAHSIIYNENDINLNRTKLKQFKRAVVEKSRFKKSQPIPDGAKELEPETGCGSKRKDIKDAMRKEQEALYKERVKTEVSLVDSFK